MSTYLEERIEWYDHNYRKGMPLISDAQFDRLEANLYNVNPKANYFTKKTKLPLPSLPKDRIKEFLNGLTLQTRLIIEPKIDGCAIAIQYINGELVKDISRKGRDLTKKNLRNSSYYLRRLLIKVYFKSGESCFHHQDMNDQVILSHKQHLL